MESVFHTPHLQFVVILFVVFSSVDKAPPARREQADTNM